ncbi:MAG: C1 family peptidase [Thermoanaerobaculaceae bacterium]|nr:C1 family peptidase [Thermoanaerobaculaceae bacterium]
MSRQTATVLATVLVVGSAWAAAPAVAPTPTPARDTAVYQPKYEDPVLKQMEEHDKQVATERDELTAKIRAAQTARKEADEKAAKVLRFDMSGIAKPASPAAFKQAWHFPPVAQYLTGTCWSFSTTSFYESEVYRLTGRKVKLSEIWTVYWEYVEKMRRFVRERGDSLIDEGSESNALPRIWKRYGIVPEEAYPGVLSKDGRHDHSRLIAQLRELSQWVKANEIWDEDRVLALTRVILDRELGVPPERFAYQGREYTPQQFLAQVVAIDLDDYAEFMSTLSLPFYTRGEYKVPDNWWHDASYYNVPLAEWYAALKHAVQQGYTVAIGGDVSEPGYNGFENAAVVPTFDIPQAYIDQSARELRFANHTTEDDHGLHLVGWTSVDGRDWFLIKDSARSSRWGKFEGYYFYRDDYVRLKMLTFVVHKDAVRELLAKFAPAQP